MSDAVAGASSIEGRVSDSREYSDEGLHPNALKGIALGATLGLMIWTAIGSAIYALVS